MRIFRSLNLKNAPCRKRGVEFKGGRRHNRRARQNRRQNSSTAKLRICTLRIWGFRGPGFRSARQVLCGDASRPFLDHFYKHLSSVLGRTELCHEVRNPGPQKPQIIRNENHHLALLEKPSRLPLHPASGRTKERGQDALQNRQDRQNRHEGYPLKLNPSFQERKGHMNLRKMPGTPAGCPWDIRRDKRGSTGRCPREFL